MELADFAVGKGHDLDAPVRHSLVQTGNVLKITGKTVDRFGQDGIEPPWLCGNQHRGCPARLDLPQRLGMQFDPQLVEGTSTSPRAQEIAVASYCMRA